MEEKYERIIKKAQIFEVTECEIYKRIAETAKDPNNKKVLMSLAEGSKKHAEYWGKITGISVEPSKLKVFVYTLIFKIFGKTFGVKLMESSEETAEKIMVEITKKYPEHKWILEEEKIHEQKLIELINENFLNYLRSIVLGANDAMVSTVGTAAGLSVALSSSRLIGMSTLISGATAALSMSASEYLSSLSEKTKRKPVVAGVITGGTYVLIVLILLIPYFFLDQYYIALFITLGIAAFVITLLSFYISIVQQISFKKRLFQNIILSFGIALISFGIGYFINKFFGLGV